MTILEIMIVLAIITGIVVMGAMNMRNPTSDVRTDIRNLLLLSKRLNQQAQLDNVIYRITFSMDKKNPTYWVEESANGTIERANQDTFAQDPDQSPFKIASKFTKDKKNLPTEFFFKKVILLEQGLFFEDGLAHIHFFPQGMADASAVQITNEAESLSWTLIINPLTGSARLVDGLFEANQLSRN